MLSSLLPAEKLNFFYPYSRNPWEVINPSPVKLESAPALHGRRALVPGDDDHLEGLECLVVERHAQDERPLQRVVERQVVREGALHGVLHRGEGTYNSV